METTEETRKEIERRSQYFDGIPPENWIFLGMKENKKIISVITRMSMEITTIHQRLRKGLIIPIRWR